MDGLVLEADGPPPALLHLGWLLGSGGSPPGESESPSRAAERLTSACHGVNLWQPNWAARRAELETDAPERLARASAWLADQAEHPWESPLAGQRQLWVSAQGARPQEAEVQPLGGYWKHGYFRTTGGIWTMTEVPGLGAPWTSMRPNWTQHLWALTPRSDARVFEVRSADDLRRLVATYPRLAEQEPFHASTSEAVIPAPFFVPAWDAIAADWDGVRFTMAGKLTTVNALLRVGDGYTMLIDEHATEETFWLRWCFTGVDDLGSVLGNVVRDPQVFAFQGSQETWPPQLAALQREGWEPVDPRGDERYTYLVGDDRFALLSRTGEPGGPDNEGCNGIAPIG